MVILFGIEEVVEVVSQEVEVEVVVLLVVTIKVFSMVVAVLFVSVKSEWNTCSDFFSNLSSRTKQNHLKQRETHHILPVSLVAPEPSCLLNCLYMCLNEIVTVLLMFL